MVNKPICAVCSGDITWRFKLCAECEEEYGKRVDDWPEWVRFLVNDEMKRRRTMTDNNRVRTGKEAYIEDQTMDGFYVMDIEELIMTKMDFAGYITVASDGIEGYEFKDSDWEAVYSFTI